MPPGKKTANDEFSFHCCWGDDGKPSTDEAKESEQPENKADFYVYLGEEHQTQTPKRR